VILDLIGAWYLLSGRSKKIDRQEVLNTVQASYECSETREEMAENLLYLLGCRRRW
jgi:hypothetical protein